jgi:hypothetical protein
MFHTNIVGKNILYVPYFFSENHTTYKIVWKNILVQGRPQMTTKYEERIKIFLPDDWGKNTDLHS